MAEPLCRFYERLLADYGPQGWWPLLAYAGSNPTGSGTSRGYHPGDYSLPHTPAQRFEIAVGAVLTQNTAWPNVEKALRALAAAGVLEPAALLALPVDRLAAQIRPSGYFNVKARKLHCLAEFALALGDRVPSRPDLLAVWGIGPETADSIRLYAYGQLEMVVDAYTRRGLARAGYRSASASYDEAKRYCVRHLPATVPVYQEFHALMVEHGKRRGKGRGSRDGTDPQPVAA